MTGVGSLPLCVSKEPSLNSSQATAIAWALDSACIGPRAPVLAPLTREDKKLCRIKAAVVTLSDHDDNFQKDKCKQKERKPIFPEL